MLLLPADMTRPVDRPPPFLGLAFRMITPLSESLLNTLADVGAAVVASIPRARQRMQGCKTGWRRAAAPSLKTVRMNAAARNALNERLTKNVSPPGSLVSAESLESNVGLTGSSSGLQLLGFFLST